MKKNLHIVLGILGLGAIGYGISQPWSGVFLKIQNMTMATEGYGMVAGQVAIGLAALTLVLLFVKPRFAAVTALAIILCAAMVYLFPKTERHAAQNGLFITVIGAAITAVGTLFVPKRRN